MSNVVPFRPYDPTRELIYGAPWWPQVQAELREARVRAGFPPPLRFPPRLGQLELPFDFCAEDPRR